MRRAAQVDLRDHRLVKNVTFHTRLSRARVLVVSLSAVLAVSSLAAGCTSAASSNGSSPKATGSPVNLNRVATDDPNYMDDLTAIGVTPACVGSQSGTPVADETSTTVAPLLAKASVFAVGPIDSEQLAACHPTVIITGDAEDPARDPKVGNVFNAVAPTVYITQPDGCFSYTNRSQDSNPTGRCFTDWKDWLHELAVALGPVYVQRAAEVITTADRRAAAIRGQVQGKVIASLYIFPATGSFSVYNANFPFSNAIVRDLGVKVPTLSAADYPSGCGPATGDCATNDLSAENFPELASADMLLIRTYTASAASIKQEESNPLFQALPAVKAGHVAAAVSTGEDGALSVADNETLIENGFGIKEYTASLTGGSGPSTDATLTYEPGTRNLCWALTPPAGTHPGGTLSLSIPGGPSLALGTPSYVPAEAASSGWNTSPVTYLASGCDTLPAADAALWQGAAGNATVSMAGQTGQVTSGITSIVYKPSS